MIVRLRVLAALLALILLGAACGGSADLTAESDPSSASRDTPSEQDDGNDEETEDDSDEAEAAGPPAPKVTDPPPREDPPAIEDPPPANPDPTIAPSGPPQAGEAPCWDIGIDELDDIAPFNMDGYKEEVDHRAGEPTCSVYDPEDEFGANRFTWLSDEEDSPEAARDVVQRKLDEVPPDDPKIESVDVGGDEGHLVTTGGEAYQLLARKGAVWIDIAFPRNGELMVEAAKLIIANA